MTKIQKAMLILLTGSALSAVNSINAKADYAGCTTGTTKLCFKVTTNGNVSYQCNTTEGSTKDCQ